MRLNRELTGDHSGVVFSTANHADMDVEGAKARNSVDFASILIAQA